MALRESTTTCHLKTSSNGRLLPKNTFNLDNGGGDGTDKHRFYAAGDVRANEQIGLAAMHTLFVREHNRLCDDLITTFPSSTGEEHYQMARKIVGAEMQAITYKEFLPALLGPMAPDLSAYSGFKNTTIPSIGKLLESTATSQSKPY
jgi:peroxidase